MTVLENSLKTLLGADSTLMAVLDGGIVTFDESKRNGIGLKSTPAQFDSVGFLKTCLLLKEATDAERGGIRDRAAKTYSNIARIELWFLQDGDDGYAALETARDRAFALLNDNAFATIGTLKRVGGMNDLRDSSLDNAAVIRSVYDVVRVKG